MTKHGLAVPGKVDIAYRMLSAAKNRAKKEGIPFNIELSDITIPEYCPALGIPLKCNTNSSGSNDNSPTLDKLVPSLGYVKGNVRVISKRANMIKTNANYQEILAVGTWLRNELTES